MGDLGCVAVSTENTIRASPLAVEPFKALQAIANQGPSMEWSIAPRKAAYLNIFNTPSMLDIRNIGEVKLRYNQEDYTLQVVRIHKPFPFAQTILDPAIAEVSCIFSGPPKKTIRWIFPVKRTTDSTAANLALTSWFTGSTGYLTGEKPLVNSFEDFLPSDFYYMQWMDCFTRSSGGSSVVNSLVTCYCLKPLLLSSSTQLPPLPSYTGTTVTIPISTLEPYSYTSDPSSYSDTDTASRFAIWRIITGKKRTERAQKRTTKCYALNLERDIDSRGMVNLDEKGAPLDPVTVQELAGRFPGANLQDEALKAAQAQQATTNTIAFYVTLGIIGLFAVVCGFYVVYHIFGKKEVTEVVSSGVDPSVQEAAWTIGMPVSRQVLKKP